MNPQQLVGLGAFNSMTGFAADPALAGWERAAMEAPGTEAAMLVTVAQHNTMVAQLAWSQSILRCPPSAVRRLPNGEPFPFGVSLDRMLELGAAPGEFVAGDVVLPAARSAGAAALPATTPGAGTYTVTSAQRALAFDATQRALAALVLHRGSIVKVPNAVSAPAGWVWPVVGVVCVGIGAYAAYSAYVDARAAEANAQTAQVRIREEQGTARVVAQVNAQTQALAARLAHAQRTGQLPPPSPVETTPIQLPQPAPDTRPVPSGLSMLWLPAAALVGAGGAGGYVYYRERRRAAP